MKIDFHKYPYPGKIRHHVGTNLYFPLKEMTFTPSYYPPILDNEDIKIYFNNNKAPDILDIGCGKGKFLLDLSEKYPDKNIMGFEVRKALVEWIQNISKSENFGNVWAMWYTVVNGLDFLEEESIEKAFYLFPDPWPKKRQQNRRLFSVSFLKDLHRVLKKDGKLYLATDCDYVHEHHLEELNKSGKFKYYEVDKDEWVFPVTNKEAFCFRKNIPVFRLICEKK